MDFQLISANDLSSDLVQRWIEIIRDNPHLSSPYYRPEFTQAVARTLDEIKIVVIKEGDLVQGFFPFQCKRNHNGEPVGGRLSGFEGLITPLHVEIDLKELLRVAQLTSWQFEQLPETQAGFDEFADKTTESHYIDLSSGFDHYLKQRKSNGNKRISKLGQLNRKFEREHGPLRFEFHSEQTDMLDLLIKLKSEQFTRTHYTDIFQVDWTKQLLKDLHASNNPDLQGRLSVLWADQRPVVLLYGLQSQQVFHGWFTAYDQEFGKYSPGSQCILKIAEAAANKGITRFDLGPGEQLFKETLSSGSLKVRSGEVSFDKFRRFRHQTYRQAHNWLKQSRFQKTSQTIFNTLRPIKGWFDMH